METVIFQYIFRNDLHSNTTDVPEQFLPLFGLKVKLVMECLAISS